MGKWSRRAFITAGVAAGGVVVLGVAIRRGDRSDKVAGLIAGERDAIFDIWLKIAPDNTVTVIVPHAEMGQGAHTALAMMLADELDADWSKVSVLEAPAHKEYANYALAKGFAAGDIDFPGWMMDTVDGFFFRATQAMSLQVTGGIGYTKDCRTEQLFRDARLMTIGGGTAEIMKFLIQREVYKERGY